MNVQVRGEHADKIKQLKRDYKEKNKRVISYETIVAKAIELIDGKDL